MSTWSTRKDLVHKVVTLHVQGVPWRAIARAVSISRNTVRKIVLQHQAARESEHTALPTPLKRRPRQKKIDAFAVQVADLFARFPDINAQRVFEDLRTRCSTPYEWEIPSRVFQPVQPPARWKSPARNIAPHRGETDDSSETEPGIGQGSPAPAHPNQPPRKE